MKFSIVTVNLNNHAGLLKTIESVVNQTFSGYEYIIIDGGSTDGSREIIEFYSTKLSFWVSEPDKGIYHAMNKGIEKAIGEYLLFLNSGDFLVDNKVLHKVSEKVTVADILLGDCDFSRDGRVIYTTSPPKELTLRNFYHQTLPHQATFIKRRLFEDYGLYNYNYKIHSDLEFWLITIILKNCSLQRLNIIVSNYNLEGISSNQQDNSISNDEFNSIFSKYIPARIIDDYKSHQNQTVSMRELLWFNSKPYRRWIVSISYKIARVLVDEKEKSKKKLKYYYQTLKKEVVFPFKSMIVRFLILSKFIWKLYSNKPIIIIVWHQVSSKFINGINNKEDWTSLNDFEKSIKYLLRKKFVFISLKQALEILTQNKTRKKRYVVFTFDDGHANLNDTIPLLERYQIPATFFINTAYLDNNTASWNNISYLVDSANSPSSIPGSVISSIDILKRNSTVENYDYFRRIAEVSFSEIGFKDNLYLNRNQLFGIRNAHFSVGLHGHEHEHHTKMSNEWCIKNIVDNYDHLKNHPNFEPYIAFPFGAYQEFEIEYWEERGFRTFACDGFVNYQNSSPIHRIAFDGRVISLQSLAKLSGESFSFMRFFKFKKSSII